MKYFSLMLFVILFGCSSAYEQIDVVSFSESNPVIRMNKTKCFGRCPVYTLEINGLGEVILVGEENINKIGKYILKIDEDELASLLKSFNDAGFWDMQDEYDGRVTDLPSTFISINYNGREKKVKSRYNSPEQLDELEKILSDYLKRFGWRRITE